MWASEGAGLRILGIWVCFVCESGIFAEHDFPLVVSSMLCRTVVIKDISHVCLGTATDQGSDDLGFQVLGLGIVPNQLKAAREAIMDSPTTPPLYTTPPPPPPSAAKKARKPRTLGDQMNPTIGIISYYHYG